MKIIVLGIFNWFNKLLLPSEVMEIARVIFGGKANVIARNDGWYASSEVFPLKFAGKEIKLMVSYSRLIAQINLDSQVGSQKTFSSINDLFEVRRDIMDLLNPYLEDRMREINQLPIIANKFANGLPKPTFFSYVVIQIERRSTLFNSILRRDSESDWSAIPFDVSTTNFFVIVPDISRKWYRHDRHIPLRIAGGLLIMGESSNRFLHRIINLIYYVGMTRIVKEIELNSDHFVFTEGLIPIVGNLGEEMSSSLIQRATEERLEKLNVIIVVFTSFMVALTSLLILFYIFTLGLIHI